MNKVVGQRYQTVAELLSGLRTPQSGSDAATPAQADVPSIAVLPFVNMSADAEQEYFCEGMAEEIINALTALDGLHVASRTSAFQAKAQDFEVAEIGVRLKVGTVLEGSVRKAGNRLRVTAQLINVSDGYHLWSERYDRDMDDVFAVQDEIARSVVEKLKVKLFGEQDAPLVTRPTDHLEAYTLVLKGRYYFAKMSGTALEKGLECFTQALAVDPAYAQAHAGIALVQTLRAFLSFAVPQQVMPMAKEAALKALSIDERVADAHFALAFVLDCYDWNWEAAEREYRRAVDLNPADGQTRCLYARHLGCMGRADASVTGGRHAVEHDPLSSFTRQIFALILSLARRFDAAMTEARAGIELERAYHPFYWNLGVASVGLGRHGEAVESLRQATTLAPGDLFSQGLLGWALGLDGQKQEALTIRTDLERRQTQEYVSGFVIALVNVGLGERDQAISWLQKAEEERDPSLSFVNSWPGLDPLRSDPRFQALLQRMNFPQQVSPGS